MGYKFLPPSYMYMLSSILRKYSIPELAPLLAPPVVPAGMTRRSKPGSYSGSDPKPLAVTPNRVRQGLSS